MLCPSMWRQARCVRNIANAHRSTAQCMLHRRHGVAPVQQRTYATDEGSGDEKPEKPEPRKAGSRPAEYGLLDDAFEKSFIQGMDDFTKDKSRNKDRIPKRKFETPTELTVPGTEDEYLYRTGVTRGLGDVQSSKSYITEIRTIEAYKLYGDMDRIKRTDFFHLSHAAVRKHCQELIDAGKVTPWTPPSGDHVLRFSWKNYLTPSSQAHPGARKVKLEVSIDDLGLDAVAQDTLVQLVGPRYHPNKRVLKLVSDSLPLREQNKAYLRDLLTTIVLESKNPATQMVAMEAMEEKAAARL